MTIKTTIAVDYIGDTDTPAFLTWTFSSDTQDLPHNVDGFTVRVKAPYDRLEEDDAILLIDNKAVSNVNRKEVDKLMAMALDMLDTPASWWRDVAKRRSLKVHDPRRSLDRLNPPY